MDLRTLTEEAYLALKKNYTKPTINSLNLPCLKKKPSMSFLKKSLCRF